MSASTPEERPPTLDDLRQQGNFQFSEHNYDAAGSLYTSALEQAGDDTDVTTILLCNRSAAYYCLGEYASAKDDALRAWQDLSEQKSIKAAYRLTKTHLALEEYNEAKTVLQTALSVLEGMEENEQTKDQTHSLQELWKQVIQAALEEKEKVETSIKFAARPVSIREFKAGKELGYGNFSEILLVTHKKTGEVFSLKRLEKKKAADLAKRQHPNVYNEISMERRVLLERIPPTNPFIVRMYHAFQDYTHLYYLMDLHIAWGDLWSELKYGKRMVGCHRSQARVWLYQLTDALDHMHKHGIVHRDLKPENILLNERGHLVVIDFGTAKDLILTELNGPEFVGTPDFMSPEAVDGTTKNLERNPLKKEDRAKEGDDDGAGPAADLWALGGIAYILQTGQTPFWSTSPYLAFLRIKRGLLTRHLGIVDDDAWDFIQSLLKVAPSKRLGADVYELVVDPDGSRRIQQNDPKGYEVLRGHPYFAPIHEKPEVLDRTPVPSLRDLCFRVVAELAHEDALDVELCDKYPPGDGSSHDMTRLSPRDRDAVLHVLYRQQRFRDHPRLYDRFFTDPIQSRLMGRIRPVTREVLGLTQMNDDHGKAPQAQMNDPHEKPVAVGDTVFAYIANPVFSGRDVDETTRKLWRKALKRAIATINRQRPKFVVVSGSKIEHSEQKLLARISDSIPVICHDGSAFFTFWFRGVQCLALSQQAGMAESSPQIAWVREQLELVRLSKHPLFVFTDKNPKDLPQRMQKRLARGRTLALFGLGEDTAQSFVRYDANEEVANDEADGTMSLKSNDSEEDEDRDTFTMKMEGHAEFGIHWVTIEPEPDQWSTRFEAIEVEESAK
jgi:serine/threonine protein kinase